MANEDMWADSPFPPPDHPDYTLISDKVAVLNRLSIAANTVEEFLDMLSGYANVESSDAVAWQRSIHLMTLLDKLPADAKVNVIMALHTAWTEGFYVGNMVNGERFADAEKVTVPDSPEGL